MALTDVRQAATTSVRWATRQLHVSSSQTYQSQGVAQEDKARRVVRQIITNLLQ
jgi:hypothetical protein